MAIRPTPSRCRASSRKTRSSTAAKARLMDKTPSPKPSSFHSFAKLPAELRLKIWASSLPGPRLVSIQCGSNMSSLSTPSSPSTTTANSSCTSPTPIPSILHACAESRAEALKTSYRPSFGFFRRPGHVLFNPSVDIMYFGPREGFMAADSQFHTCMALCDPAELAGVRRLAVNDALFWTGTSYNSLTAASFTLELLRQIAMRMTGLRELIFVPWEEELVVDEGVVHERMARQIQTAMQSVMQQFPSWRPPPWRIVPLNQLPSPTG